MWHCRLLLLVASLLILVGFTAYVESSEYSKTSLTNQFKDVSAERMQEGRSSKKKSSASSCNAPYETPSYKNPPDDSVAFGSLLEAAGYAAAINSDWKDIAAGNFCGGSEAELVLVKNKHSYFSILRGPAPYAVGTGDLISNPSHPWRAVAAANLDGGTHDEIIAVRKVTAPGVPDLIVMKASDPSCDVSRVIASAQVGNEANSEWLDAAVGRFDGTGRMQIALLKAKHSNLFLVNFTAPSTLTVTSTSDLDTNPAGKWKALAAGDIDCDGIDELIAARQINSNVSATVLVYKWTNGGFQLFRTSKFGNNGNSDWASATVGDFNADGRKAIVLVKNEHSNFVILDFPRGANNLRELSTADLDSVGGQQWRGVVAIDWLSGSDKGASELIAVRAAHDKYRTDLFVYGDHFNRVSRETALERTKSWWDHDKAIPINDLKDTLTDSHTNTLNFHLDRRDDYLELVKLLDTTKGFCVDGKQFRVWVTLIGPGGVKTSGAPEEFKCSNPVDSPITPWRELDFFHGPSINEHCKDYLGWASLIGRLAQDYPHLVAVGMDDFMTDLEAFPGDYLAEMGSRMRSQSPWLNFVPTVYYGGFFPRLFSFPSGWTRGEAKWPDVSLTFDTMLYYFRNEKAGECLSGSCGEASVANAPGEFSDMDKFIPPGRKMQVGVYYGILWRDPPMEGTPRYVYDLTTLILNIPSLGGVTAYPAQNNRTACTESDSHLKDKYCAIRKAYGDRPLWPNSRGK